MFERLFKEKRIPHMLIIVSLLAGILVYTSLFTNIIQVSNKASLVPPNNLSVFYMWINSLFGETSWWYIAKFAVFAIPSLLFLDQIAKNIKIFGDIYTMPVWLAFLVLLLLYSYDGFGTIVPAFMFLVMSSKSLLNFNMYRNGAFDSGLYLGIASLLFLPSIVLIIACIFGVLGLTAKKLSSILLFLIGLILPAGLLGMSVYVFDIDISINIIELFSSYISMESDYPTTILIYSSVILLITLLSAIVFNNVITEKTVWDRMLNSYFLIFAASIVIGCVLLPNLLRYFLVIYTIPFSYFFSLLYLGLKKKKPIYRLILVDGFTLFTLVQLSIVIFKSSVY